LKNHLNERNERKTKIQEGLKNLKNLKLVIKIKNYNKKIAIKTKTTTIATEL
jgi:hypothetical protein